MIYSLKEVSKSYSTRSGDVPALNRVTFDIQRGERVAVLGPSGSGKTTLFRLLNATLRPTHGVLKFDGRYLGSMSGKDLRIIRRRIGTIYQQHHLVPSLSALQNTLCGKLGSWSMLQTLRSLARPKNQEVERAMSALESVGLGEKRHARADELSGGQQQRLTIARVLMQDPEVILADEPFASLDPALTETVAALLFDLVESGRRTLVATMHDVELALRYFPQIIAVREGNILFDHQASEVNRDAISALYASERVAGSAPDPADEASPVTRSKRLRESTCAR